MAPIPGIVCSGLFISYRMFTSCVCHSVYEPAHVDGLRLPIEVNYLPPVWSEIKYLVGGVFRDELYFLSIIDYYLQAESLKDGSVFYSSYKAIAAWHHYFFFFSVRGISFLPSIVIGKF